MYQDNKLDIFLLKLSVASVLFVESIFFLEFKKRNA